jgi:hypothetical protein
MWRALLLSSLASALHPLCQPLLAQRFGGNPPSMKWRQLDAERVRVVYPLGKDSLAARVRDVSEHMYRTTTSTLGDGRRKIDIVLQDQPLTTNGYVGLAPWRSEFFLNPLQNSLDLGSVPWVDLLALHEYRHVQQYMNFRKGMSRFAWILAGEQGQALANSAAVPDWFFEGDAVLQETMASRQGRGRLPEFFNGYRSLWNEGRRYGYMKLRNGSLKDYVPNHYQLGYLLVAAGRERFGDAFWRKVTEEAVRFKSPVYPFQSAFKRQAGIDFKTFADSLLRPAIGPSSRMISSKEKALTSAQRRNVVDHHLPRIVGKDSLLVLRYSYRDIPEWRLLTPSGSRRIEVRDIAIDDYYSQAAGRIAYTHGRPHPRWSWREYGGITVTDMRTGESRRIAKDSRYLSPSLSHDGEKLVAVSASTDGRTTLHILDATDGRLSSVVPGTEGLFLTHPVFSGDGRSVLAAARDARGRMALLSIDTASGSHRLLQPWTFRPIAFPRVSGDLVAFNTVWKGNDAVMVWDDNTKTTSLLPIGATGMYGPDLSVEEDRVVYSRFTTTGMQVFAARLSDAVPIDPSMLSEEDVQRVMYGDWIERSKYALDSIPALGGSPRKYNGGTRLFNFHSWRPWYQQPEWSFSLYGENVLNTFSSEVFYQYNQNEGFHRVGFNGAYAGWYPWVTGNLSYTVDRTVNLPAQPGTGAQTLRWDEWNAGLGLRLPLNFSGGRHYRFLTLQSAFNNVQVMYRPSSSPKPQDRAVNYLESGLTWSMQSQQARQHIFPRFAHVLRLQNRVAMGSTAANQNLASGALYLPGILKTQNLVFTGSFQSRDTLKQYYFPNQFALARGYTGLDYPRMWRVSANYHFTIAYPDVGFAQLVYLLRLRGNAFYDASWVRSLRMQKTTPLRSVGMELFFDTKWWNQVPVTFGVRYARLLDADAMPKPPNPNFWEFIIPIDLIPD